jgi:hypothetical protein
VAAAEDEGADRQQQRLRPRNDGVDEAGGVDDMENGVSECPDVRSCGAPWFEA